MFEKNDKQLLTARIFLNVITWIFVIVGIVCGIVYLVDNSIVTGLLFLLLVPFLSWIMWVFARLYLTYLCDIKLIRNKLYGTENDNLKVFLEDTDDSDDEKDATAQTESKTMEDITAQLLELKALLDSGAIAQEEFDAEKERLLKQ